MRLKTLSQDGIVSLIQKDQFLYSGGGGIVQSVSTDNIKKMLNLTGEKFIVPSNFGNNLFTKMTECNSLLEMKVTGRHYINLIADAGKCDNPGKWGIATGNLTLDNENALFGGKCLKCYGGDAFGWGDYSNELPAFDRTKNYILSGYIKNANATQIRVRITDGTTEKSFAATQVTANLLRGIVRIPANTHSNTPVYCSIVVVGSSTVYGFADGLMLTEVPSEDLSLTDAQLMIKYPYVEEIAAVKNPSITITQQNLVRNGNCEEGIFGWRPIDPSCSAQVFNNKMRVTSTNGNKGMGQLISVQPNTDYYLSANVVDGTAVGLIRIYDATYTTQLAYNNGVFNTGNRDKIVVYASVVSTGYADFSNIQLTSGTIQLPYKTFDQSRLVIEGTFYNDEVITYKNHKVTGNKLRREISLIGTDMTWKFAKSITGYKWLFFDLPKDAFTAVDKNNIAIEINNNKQLQWTFSSYMATPITYELFDYDSINKRVIVALDNRLTGWAEADTPTSDWIKAYFLGWFKFVGFNVWIDQNELVSIHTVTGTGTDSANFDLDNVTGLSIGDSLYIPVNATTYGLSTIKSISGNRITMNGSGFGEAVGGKVYRVLNNVGTADLTYATSHRAPKCTNMKAVYMLEKPEPINEKDYKINGDLPFIKPGIDLIEVENGVVLDEFAIANDWGDGAAINNGVQISTNHSFLRHKLETFYQVKKDGVSDASWMIDYNNPYRYGKAVLWTTNRIFGPMYTIDYRIIKENAPNIGTIELSFNDGLQASNKNLTESINNMAKPSGHVQEVKGVGLMNLVDTVIYTDDRITDRSYITIIPINKQPIGVLKTETFNGGFKITSTLTEVNLQFLWTVETV